MFKRFIQHLNVVYDQTIKPKHTILSSILHQTDRDVLTALILISTKRADYYFTSRGGGATDEIDLETVE